jgi:hypothetical protein
MPVPTVLVPQASDDDHGTANTAESLMRALLKAACSGQIVRNALRIALVVGTVLNLINQGSAILAASGISWIHVAMNYLVPYCVASYSAAKNELTRRRGL